MKYKCMKRQKNIVLINDLSGYGRCSLTVSIPVISAMKIQCIPIPTAILSNHTNYDTYYFQDFTDHMQPYMDEYEKLGLHFDGIYSGFLGSVRQVEIVRRFILKHKRPETKIIVDPVMGDNGELYPTMDAALASQLKELVSLADIITPNLTEACLLCEEEYRKDPDEMELTRIAHKLHDLGPDLVVISGIEQDGDIISYASIKDKRMKEIHVIKNNISRCGTGDLFASIIAADAVNDVPFIRSVKKASRFVAKCMKVSDELGVEPRNGVAFEEILADLMEE